ncbi:MAG: hypothetical protein DRJ59_04440 [Thermoprotei archaeon]|nr:MAG: hypothetical protein DRJ59_04440 [Thermoprotei archaeon]
MKAIRDRKVVLSLALSLVCRGCILLYIEFSQFNILSMIMLWICGLLIWFFGIYSFIEREVRGVCERLESLRQLEKKRSI